MSSTGNALPAGVRQFHPDGRRPPLVMLGTFPAREKSYVEHLAAVLDPDLPLFFINPPEIGGPDELARIMQWVDHFRATLDALPVSPPYYLVGYSFGGVLALELARVLRADDVPVKYVAMIDTARPNPHPRTAAEKLIDIFAGAERVPAGHRAMYFRKRVAAIVRFRRQGAVARLRRLTGREATGDDPDSQWRTPLHRAIAISFLKYVGEPVDFPVAVFACPPTMAMRANDPSLAWAPLLLGGFEQISIEGEHLTILTPPHVTDTAASLERSLARAEVASGAPVGHIPQRV